MVSPNSGIVRGFAKTKEQMQALKDHGLPDRAIYLDGRGAETLETCLSSFRDRPGTLVIARDLRLVSDTKRGVADFMARMELASIRVHASTHHTDEGECCDLCGWPIQPEAVDVLTVINSQPQT